MNKIAALDSGTAYHISSFYTKPFKDFLYKTIYLPNLDIDDLKDVDILIVSCSSSVEQILKHKNIFYEFLAKKKFLVVMGRNEAQLWLNDVVFADLPFNFWWWLDKNNKIDLKPACLDYGLFKYIDFKDMVWHYHGGYEKIKGCISVIEHISLDKSIFLEMPDYYGGRLILTSLDPFFHHGNFFMPNATKLGGALLKYLSEVKL